MTRMPILLLAAGLVGAASLSGCATKSYVDEQIMLVNTRIDQVDARAADGIRRADAAAAAAANAAAAAQAANGAAQSAASAAQAAANDARNANSRIDSVTTRVDTLEQWRSTQTAPPARRRPRG